MQREIKFRAWDKRFNNLVDWEIVKDWKIYILNDDTQTARVFMQYTGLKDKNGKEIYFGDILQSSNLLPKEGEDSWEARDWGYTVVEENPKELGVNYSKWAMNDYDDDVYSEKFCEVIGNIYENPELLNNK